MLYLNVLGLRASMAAAALAFGAIAAPASATVIHVGPNDGYHPIYSAADLVVNGNFNVDPLVDPANEFAANPNVSGWTISPAVEFPGTRNSNAGVGADGRGLRLGDSRLIDVSQDLATVVGTRYRLSFFLAVDGEPDDLFRVYAGSQLLANLDRTPYPPFDQGFFSQYLYDFKATDAATTLRFEYQSPYGDQYLSNVSVLTAPVPEAQTWAMLLAGLMALGGAVHRKPPHRHRARVLRA